MATNSNSLLRERTSGRRAETHPHAEVLAAFAQEKLLPGDSEKVLAHLSRCADCRALLRVTTAAPQPQLAVKAAAPVAATPVAVPASYGRLSRGLPRVLTGLVLLGLGAGVMLYHRESPAPETMETEIAAPGAQAEPSSGALPPPASSQGRMAEAPPKTPSVKAGSADTAHSSAHPDSAEPSQPGAATAGHPKPPQAGVKTGVAATAGPVHAKAPADTPPVSSENLGASPGEPAQTAQEAASDPPPPTSAEATAVEAVRPGALAQHPGGLTAQWRIGDGGQVERSQGDGTWQQMFDPRAKLHVVTAIGSVVWAGGEDLHLYRSRDNGATWGRIELPVKDSGNSAIERIRFENAHEGTVESDNGNSWATTDGGTTWH